MASQTAYNYFLSEVNSTINQIASAQQSAADLTLVSRSIERSALNGLVSEMRALCASDPALERLYLAFSDAPVLQLLDTRGQETGRISLPSRSAVRDSFFTFLSGSGYTPASTAEANAYYARVNELLAARALNESADFALINGFAQEAEKQVPALLDRVRFFEPPVREWFGALAWEAGDGNDRARELLGYSFSLALMSREIDDYSSPGQTLISDRATLRLAVPDPVRVDSANCLLDELNGNIDTTSLSPQCFTAFGPEEIAANQSSLDSLLRFIPALHSSGGVSIALARVQEEVTDPDMLAEASAELVFKGTEQDPVLSAIRKAAGDAVERYGLPDLTRELLEVEARAHAFLVLAEDLFGPKASPFFRMMTALGPDERLSGYRRREGLLTLHEALIPEHLKPETGEVRAFLWMLANRKMAPNRYTTELWKRYVEGMPSEDYWALQAFVDTDFVTPEIVAQAEERALAELADDLGREEWTGLTAQDPATFKDALEKLATVAVTPEDRQVQRERLRDLGQRMSILADTVTYRHTLEVATGGGYLALEEYHDLYRALVRDAVRVFAEEKNPELVKAELGAFGNLSFSDRLAESLFDALQAASGDFFSEDNNGIFMVLLGEFRLGAGALAYDRYWSAKIGLQAKLLFDSCVMLSRTLHTATDPAEQTQAAASARFAFAQVSGLLADSGSTRALVEALLQKRKTPQATQDELEFLAFICRGNEQLEHAYTELTQAVRAAFGAIAAGLPPVSMEDYYGATALAYYPLQLFARNNEYAAGIVMTAVNHAIQGGRVLSQLGNSATVWEAARTSGPVPVTRFVQTASPYGTNYFAQGCDDVTSQVRYDPDFYTFGGENPIQSFSSGLYDSPYGGAISGFVPDMRSGGATSNLTESITATVSGLMGGKGQNLLCQCEALTGLIQQLNGVMGGLGGAGGGLGGAVTGGINNALGAVNDALYGMTGQLNGLLKGLGNMGSMNMGAPCKCMSFDLSANLQKLLEPISSWLKNFGSAGAGKNIFDGLKNPFKLNPNEGCAKDFLGNLGSGVKFPP